MSDHWSLARLIDLARGVLNEEERREAEDHLLSCARCVEENAWARSIERTLREGPLADPPAGLVEQAYRIYPKPLSWPTGERAARLTHSVASLVRDSATEPMPAGIRAGASVSRQLLFEAEGADIDLKLFPGESGRTMSLYGQIAPRRPAANPAGLDVELVAAQARNASTKTNQFGEFVFENVPAGDFAVAVFFEHSVLTIGPVRGST